MPIYAGSTKKFLIRIRDSAGNQVDPSDPQTVVEVKVFLYNAIDGTTISKYYLNNAPATTGWSPMTIKTVGEGDKRMEFIMTPAQTNAAKGNSNMIQIDTHYADPDCAGNIRIEIKKGKFIEIKPAES